MAWNLVKLKKKRKIKKRETNTNSIEFELEKRTLTVYYQNIIDKLLLNTIYENLNELFSRIFLYLENDENSTEETALFLDELARQRSVYREYEKKLSQKAVSKYMRKIRLVVFELKKCLRNYDLEQSQIKNKRR